MLFVDGQDLTSQHDGFMAMVDPFDPAMAPMAILGTIPGQGVRIDYIYTGEISISFDTG